MTKKVYTLGYSGRKPAEIKKIAEKLNAVVFDIRFSPRSRAPQWTKKRLTEVLGITGYMHLKALGNANYKNGGPIEFVDFEAGLQAIEASSRPVILMCGCKSPNGCHRTTAARQLIEQGFNVKEYGKNGPMFIPALAMTQLLLF